MNYQALNTILNKYEKEDKIYFSLLCRIMKGCSNHFSELLEKAEKESKRLYLIVDDEAEAAKDGIYTDGTISLEHIGIH